MPTYNIWLQNKDGTGTAHPVEGRKFKVTLDGAEFWFFVHEDPNVIGLWKVSDLRSGRKCIEIPHATLAASRGNTLAAAKAAWKKFMSGRNEKSVRYVIEAAPALEESSR